MKKEMMLLSGIILAFALVQIASAGVGIKWEQESFSVKEGEKTCLTYSVYNPWPEDTYVSIELPDSLKSVLTSQEAETKLIPANTASKDAIPLKFCFKIPKVYSQECLAGSFICKKECKEEQKVYEGDVSVRSVPANTAISGSGGSATSMAVSAPLRLRVQCKSTGFDFTLVYVALVIISALVIFLILFNKYRKPKIERDKEKLRKLKEEMKRDKKK